METVLLAEDRASLAEMLREAFAEEGWSVDHASGGSSAIRRIESGRRYSVVLTDLRMPGADGLAVLEAVKGADPLCPVVVMTGFGTVESAVEAMKLGAFEFLQKPVDLDHLILLIRRCIEHRKLSRENILLREEVGKRKGMPAIVGESGAIRSALDHARKVAASDATVLLRGETGTGKELFARAIHTLSERADEPFVAINCAAIPETLIENELFGHEKGAYTGAASRQMGKFELAHRGTIFLDEIGDLGAPVQAKILRVLEERAFERVGGTRRIEVDVRIVCATNADLETAVDEGRFRRDLFYRINVISLEIPPLRERGEDVIQVARHFIENRTRTGGRKVLTLAESAGEAMKRYRWPGNIRELQNRLERALILAEGTEITAADLGLELADRDRARSLTEIASMDLPLPDRVARAAEQVERLAIEETLKRNEDRKAAAETLGIAYRTLLARIRDYGLD